MLQESQGSTTFCETKASSESWSKENLNLQEDNLIYGRDTEAKKGCCF